MSFDDESLMALGRVTVAGSDLQHQIVRLHLRLEGRVHGPLEPLLTRPSGEVRAAVRKLAYSYPDPALRRLALEWLRDAAAALRLRNSVVHAVWLIPPESEGPGPAYIGFQIRGGESVPGDAATLNGIAQQIIAVANRGDALNWSLLAAMDDFYRCGQPAD